MPRKKTIQQRELEMVMKKHLDELGRKITVIAARNSKVSRIQKDHLRDNYNWGVKPYNVLTVAQKYYGKYNTPKGQPTPKDRSNLKNTALLNSINDNVPEGVSVMVRDMIDLLASPIIGKK